MKHISFLLLICSFPLFAQAQFVGCAEQSNLQPAAWKASFPEDYQGSYAFGCSEEESTLRLMVSGATVVAQVKRIELRGERFIWSYQNLSNVFIDGNRFVSDEATGTFVRFQFEGEKRLGLKIDRPWSSLPEAGMYEIGSYRAEIYLSGKYPEASTGLLAEEALADVTRAELQLMRNEIFARYGYSFRKGGKMDTYFQQTDWYKAQHADVNLFLTPIERRNISLIRSLEAER
ncbi:MAG: YARHG domain-containing protein [Bacteroidota bacterium]